MSNNARRFMVEYGAALAFTAAAVLVRWLLDPWLGPHFPIAILFGSIAAAVWFGGYRPALLAMVVGYIAFDLLFIEPRGQIEVRTFPQWLGLLTYITSCGFIIFFGEGMRVALRRASGADDAVRNAEGQLRTIAETLPSLISYVGSDGRYRLLNREYEVWFGKPRDELVGKHMREVLGEAAWTTIGPKVEQSLRGKRVDYEAEVTYETAGHRWISASYVPDVDQQGKVRGMAVLVNDITAAREREAAVRRQNERLRLLSEAASVLLSTDEPDAMMQNLFTKIGPHFGLDTYFNFMVDETGDALRLESCTGIPAETSRSISRLEFGQAVCGTVAVQRAPIVATHIQESSDPKVQLVRSFGIRCYACNPLMAGERLLGTLSFASRTRDTLYPEETEFLRTISHYVAAAYERLRLIRQLREGDRRKDEFLATLAHELRNPLAPVRNAVQILRMRGPDSPELEWSRDVIDRQMAQMTRLIDDLLDVSRITRNKLELRTSRVDLENVVQGAIETSRPVIEASGHTLNVSLPVQPVPLQADITRLAQVFSNLLNNAAKYTPRAGQIWLTAERQGSDIVVVVKDSGVGIPSDQLPRIFDMFAQVDGSLERSQGGLGIGLTLVKRIVELHGGSVEARSEGAGKGSEFVVRLPLLIERTDQLTGATSNTKLPSEVRSSLRILVVDDNRDSADSLGMMLRIMGNVIRTAYDGEEAINAAMEFLPEVMLLDIGLPKLNGYEVARRVRELSWGKHAILIALTGWGQDQDRQRSHEAGFDQHITKPVDPATLMKLLANLQSSKG